MTNTNSNWKNKPFLLQPCGKDYLWGGSRLRDDFSKNLDMETLAESWECSTHPEGQSVAATGEHKGKTLTQILQENPQYLGTHPDGRVGLPVLIKFIDAKKDLSVQVHPTDEYAQTHEGELRGKNEMWYVLDAQKGTQLVYGFKETVDRETVRKSIQQGTIEEYLQKVPIQKDDVFYIEAGTVHAIGAGALIAEIQESSNLTYRLYDYDRVDKNGEKRPLHLEKALDVAKLDRALRPRQPMRVLNYRPGWASELLCRCKYFQTERVLINTERCRDMVAFQTWENSFQVLLCTDGCGMLLVEEDVSLPLFRGDCVFIPANSVRMKLHGKAQFLKISC